MMYKLTLCPFLNKGFISINNNYKTKTWAVLCAKPPCMFEKSNEKRAECGSSSSTSYCHITGPVHHKPLHTDRGSERENVIIMVNMNWLHFPLSQTVV